MLLLGLYALLFAALAFNPYDRATWLAENLTVWIIVGVITLLWWRGIRFSNTACVFASVLIYLHTLGGHYTFERVPFGWVTGYFGFHRNHFDRVAHFSVGLYAFAIAEWLHTKRLVANRFLLFTYPVFVIATIAMSYELIEWWYAAAAESAEAASNYLGSQGDIWDAQKDMLSDTLGGIVATSMYFALRKPAPASV